MTIEIHEPKVEALIQQWMESGRFGSVEEAIAVALETAPPPAVSEKPRPKLTGADIIAAFQKCPHPEIDLEPERLYMPVRDFTW
jgi:hypothetical protein